MAARQGCGTRPTLASSSRNPTFLAASAVALSRQGSSHALQRAERALELAPHLADAWLALAKVRVTDGDTLAAIKPAAEAYRRGPSLAEPINFIGGLFDEIGPLEAARHYLSRACELDPESNAHLTLARATFFLGDVAETRRLTREGTAATALVRFSSQCRYAMWTRDASWLPTSAPPPMRTFALPKILSEIGNRGTASADTRAEFATLRGQVKRGRFPRFLAQVAAEIAAATGEPDPFDALAEAVDHGTADVMWLDHCPLFTQLKSDPRWPRLYAIVAGRADELREALAREGIT